MYSLLFLTKNTIVGIRLDKMCAVKMYKITFIYPIHTITFEMYLKTPKIVAQFFVYIFIYILSCVKIRSLISLHGFICNILLKTGS